MLIKAHYMYYALIHKFFFIALHTSYILYIHINFSYLYIGEERLYKLTQSLTSGNHTYKHMYHVLQCLIAVNPCTCYTKWPSLMLTIRQGNPSGLAHNPQSKTMPERMRLQWCLVSHDDLVIKCLVIQEVNNNI